MLDTKLLRQELAAIEDKLKIKGFSLDSQLITELEAKRKACQVETQACQHDKNTRSKEVGQMKARGEDASALFAEMKQLSDTMKQNEERLNTIQTQLQDYLLGVPNIPHESVPAGDSEEDNICERVVGQPTAFDFTPKDHTELGSAKAQMDFETASNMSGARYVVLKSELARLHRALAQFMLDTHLGHGYQEVYVPYIVNASALRGTGQLPKFEADLFQIQSDNSEEQKEKAYLIPTAEVPVTNLLANSIVQYTDLPLQFVTQTPCFRSEAGSYGKDTKGMIRQHQFEKVELVHFVKPDESYQALETLTNNAERILQLLELPYRVMTLCGGDLGFSAAKTYDIEVWLPGQQLYREISSCSNFEDFQARRLGARYRCPETGKPKLLHTLNGSALAVGRTLVAVLENYQQADGSVTVPEVLRPYMVGVERLFAS